MLQKFFYWTKVAVGLAQGFGFQRDVSKSQNLTVSEKKIWRRIWWCLFEKIVMFPLPLEDPLLLI